MNDCVFCGIGKKSVKSQVVYETANVIAFLDNRPIAPGHTLVMPKKHYPDMLSTPDAVLAEVLAVAKKVAGVVMNATDAAGFNIGINHGAAAGQEIMHVHVHIIPRHKNDKLVPWKNKPATVQELERMQDKILVHLL